MESPSAHTHRLPLIAGNGLPNPPGKQNRTYRSSLVAVNSALFSGFVWMRRLAVRTNWPTVAEKPDRNALKG